MRQYFGFVFSAVSRLCLIPKDRVNFSRIGSASGNANGRELIVPLLGAHREGVFLVIWNYKLGTMGWHPYECVWSMECVHLSICLCKSHSVTFCCRHVEVNVFNSLLTETRLPELWQGKADTHRCGCNVLRVIGEITNAHLAVVVIFVRANWTAPKWSVINSKHVWAQLN